MNRSPTFCLAVAIALGAALTLTPEQASAQEFFSGRLTTSSPVSQVIRPGCYHDLHKVWLEAGRRYTIDLSSPQFDAYLYLLDGYRNVLARDDDSGGNLNARIVFTPPASGWYEVMATTFHRGATGSYYLRIVGRRPV